jgi:hypothetical protein
LVEVQYTYERSTRIMIGEAVRASVAGVPPALGTGAGLLIRRIQGVGSGEKEARIDSEKIEPELTVNPCSQRTR